MGKPKNPHTDEQIIALYNETMSAHTTAKQLGIGSNTVYRALYRNNIAPTGLEKYRRSAERYPRETQEEMKNLYESGMSVPELKEKFGGSIETVCQAIRRVGGIMRPPTGHKTELTPEQEIAVCAMYKGGIAKAGIEAIFKISHHIIDRTLHQHNVPLRERKKRIDKLGRCIRPDGYVYVILDKNDPMDCMRLQGKKYVLEHRLVMARKLNRPLLPTETVHHIDGNKSNNHPDNLELRQGKHGKGTVMCCLDCGSKNIGHGKLS